MGSPEWIDQLFRSPPARKLKGHWRRTQYHQFFSSQMNQMVGVQGRNEACAVLAIEYLMRLGHLNRVKPQPFITDMDEFGAEICPDFFADSQRGRPAHFIIEVKSSRFLTSLKQLELDGYRERFAQFGMKYLVWTDKRPLSHPVRHHLLQMRGSANRDVTPAERQTLVGWVSSHSRPNLALFFAEDFDLDLLYASAWHGEVFFPITKPLSPTTPLTLRPQEDLEAIFLDCVNSVDRWWSELSLCH